MFCTQEMNDRKTLSTAQIDACLPNLACYLSCLSYEQVRYAGSDFHFDLRILYQSLLSIFTKYNNLLYQFLPFILKATGPQFLRHASNF